MHRAKIRSYLLFILAVLLALSGPISTVTISSQNSSALDDATLDIFAENNIMFYDPDENMVDCGSTNASSKPTGEQITWIGDSYSVGAKTIIEEKLPGVDIHAQGSKHFKMDAGASAGGDSGLTILKQIKDSGQLRPYLVFALGTNDQVNQNTMKSYIEELESITGEGTKIVLVTAYTKAKGAYTDGNNAIKEASQTYNNIFVADWAAVAKDEYYTSDSEAVHPTANGGYQAWVDTIYNALPGSSAGLVAGNNNGEKVWNLFVNKGISNPAVIAGIIGNMAVETGGGDYTKIDPFLKGISGSSFYGLTQAMDIYGGNDLKNRVDSAVGKDLWHTMSTPSKATQAEIDTALSVEVDWLLETAGKGWSDSKFWFFDVVNSPNISNIVSNTGGETGAVSFAELFIILVENCFDDEQKYAGTGPLTDPKVIAYKNTISSIKHHTYYQTVNKRTTAAKKAYNNLASSSVSGSSTPSASSMTSSSSSTYNWNNGWLSSLGSVSVAKEDATSWTSDTIQDSYETSSPNKILLHNTEGTTSGKAAYPSGSAYPSHFTIDVVKKQISQHIPITKPATGIASHDRSAGVQIEIVGWSSAGHESSEYYLQNFTAEQWDFLVVLLNAISSETGIPLTSSVDWTIYGNPSERLSISEFKNYTGVLGHMHAPDNDHNDPGNIWHFIEEAIKRNPSASSFATGSTNPCFGSSGLVSGGFSSVDEADKKIMAPYRALEGTSTDILEKDYNIVSGDGCKAGRLHNCVSFSRYFITQYSDVDVSSVRGHGCAIVNNYKDLPGITYGGTTPKVYAIFSRNSKKAGCASSCADGCEGHTGVVLGIDEANNKIIIGEAGCDADASWTGAHEYNLSDYTNGSYTYLYIDNLKGL